MKIKIIIVGAALLLVVLTLGTGVAFGSNTHFLRGNPVVHIPDVNLEQVVRHALKMPAGDLHASDMERVYTISSNNNSIGDLTGLEYCTNLWCLELNNNHISDLSPILKLTKIEGLFLYDNDIQTFPDLSGMRELCGLLPDLSGRLGFCTLVLDHNRISDISPVAKLTGLRGISLGDNQISDISPLAGLSKLEIVHLRNNQITDLTPLANHKELTALDCSGNLISDISPLAGLNIKSNLDLSRNRITDVTVLAGITPQYLDVSGNLIEDISPLVNKQALILGVPGPYEVYFWSLAGNPLNQSSLEIFMPELLAWRILEPPGFGNESTIVFKPS